MTERHSSRFWDGLKHLHKSLLTLLQTMPTLTTEVYLRLWELIPLWQCPQEQPLTTSFPSGLGLCENTYSTAHKSLISLQFATMWDWCNVGSSWQRQQPIQRNSDPTSSQLPPPAYLGEWRDVRRPAKTYSIVCPACPGYTPGCPPSRSCMEQLTQEATRTCPCQMWTEPLHSPPYL